MKTAFLDSQISKIKQEFFYDRNSRSNDFDIEHSNKMSSGWVVTCKEPKLNRNDVFGAVYQVVCGGAWDGEGWSRKVNWRGWHSKYTELDKTTFPLILKIAKALHNQLKLKELGEMIDWYEKQKLPILRSDIEVKADELGLRPKRKLQENHGFYVWVVFHLMTLSEKNKDLDLLSWIVEYLLTMYPCKKCRRNLQANSKNKTWTPIMKAPITQVSSLVKIWMLHNVVNLETEKDSTWLEKPFKFSDFTPHSMDAHNPWDKNPNTEYYIDKISLEKWVKENLEEKERKIKERLENFYGRALKYTDNRVYKSNRKEGKITADTDDSCVSCKSDVENEVVVVKESKKKKKNK